MGEVLEVLEVLVEEPVDVTVVVVVGRVGLVLLHTLQY